MKKLNLLTVLALSTMLVSCTTTDPKPSSTPVAGDIPTSSTATPTSSAGETSSTITLATPVVVVTGKVVTWLIVPDALSYNVYIDSATTPINVTGDRYTVPMNGSVASKSVQVTAVNGENESAKSVAVQVTYTADTNYSWTRTAEIQPAWELNGEYKPGVGEGFDLGGEVTDQVKNGKSSISNCVAITNEHKIMTIAARAFKGQEGENTHGAQIVVKVNGTVVKAAGYDTDEVTLPLNTDALLGYSYDLSTYVGQTVALEIAQVYEAAHHCVLVRIAIEANTQAVTVGSKTEWDRQGMIDEWTLAGNRREGVNEGYDLNSYDDGIVSSTAKVVTVTEDTKHLAIVARMFSGQDGSGADEDYYRTSEMVVRANGELVKPIGYDTDYAKVISSTSAQLTHYFDLSAYVGETINLSIAQENNKTGHCVIQKVTMMKNDLLTNTTTRAIYNADTLETDWLKTNSSRKITEGVELSSQHDQWASISKMATITPRNHLMSVNVRAFGSTSANPKMVVLVNGIRMRAVGESNDYFEIDKSLDGWSAQTHVYDLAQFYGADPVMITILSENDACNQAVVQYVNFTGNISSQEMASRYDKDNLLDVFSINGKYNIITEGINVNTWDGTAAMYGSLFFSDSTKSLMTLNLRMFEGQDGAGTPEDPYKNGKIIVKVNGQVVAEQDAKEELDAGTDADQIFVYDLQDYVGRLVCLQVLFDGKTGHNVIQSVSFGQSPTRA